jgi:hypothetical protein
MPSEAELPAPIFAGFFPKHAERSAETIQAPGVDRVRSVSECISKGPEDWIQHWAHNELGFFDREDTALSIVENPSENYELYAYTVYPLRWNEDGTVEDWRPGAAPGDLPSGYEHIGYDVVSKSFSSFFECSPLSCNAGFQEFSVNEHCLFSDLETARTAIVRFATGDYEPGSYYLVGVYLKRR